jgi:RNA recognition motif-containing protein
VKSQRLKRPDIPQQNITSAYAIAYVNFEKEEEASLAIEKLSGFNFEGRILQVEIYNKS